MTSIIQAKAVLDKLGVVYQDDSIGEQERWKPFRFEKDTFTLNYLGTQHILSATERKSWQRCGFFNCPYGTFFRQPVLPDLARQAVMFHSMRLWVLEELEKLFSNPFTIAHPQACAVLGLSYPFTHDQLKAAYRALVMQHHPDKGGDPEEFLLVQAAYQQLREVMAV